MIPFLTPPPPLASCASASVQRVVLCLLAPVLLPAAWEPTKLSHQGGAVGVMPTPEGQAPPASSASEASEGLPRVNSLPRLSSSQSPRSARGSVSARGAVPPDGAPMISPRVVVRKSVKASGDSSDPFLGHRGSCAEAREAAVHFGPSNVAPPRTPRARHHLKPLESRDVAGPVGVGALDSDLLDGTNIDVEGTSEEVEPSDCEGLPGSRRGSVAPLAGKRGPKHR